MAIIDVQKVTKVYPARRGTRDLRGRGGLSDWIRGRRGETFEALQDITLTVEPGESLGIIGRNGSGKSTLLKIIAGVTLPTRGEVTVRGRIASLLELGAGFHPILTGRENIYLNAGLLGMRHAQVDEVFDDIVAFSGIGDFIDQPVDTYSSGMYVRIAFAVAVHTNPDVFLVDEVLSVGDEEFQRQCRTRIGELKEQGKTIVFVSHDLGVVNTLCDRVVLLNKGAMITRQSTQKTIEFYLRQVGRDRGVHTFRSGTLEAIHCDGRISLFREEEEVTSSHGIALEVVSMDTRHASTDADWEVSEADKTGCRARGRMTRLPVTLDWDLRLEGERLVWKASLECEHDSEFGYIGGAVCLPTAFSRWHCAGLAGDFPEIRPADTTQNTVAAPESSSCETAILPPEDSPLPPVMFRLTSHNRQFEFAWANSKYMDYSRILLIHARFPAKEARFAAGRHQLFTLESCLGSSPEEIVSQIQAGGAVSSGALSVRFEQGRLRLAHGGREFSAFLHGYAAMLIDQLWNDSHSFQWEDLSCDGVRLTARGRSRRFPFAQDWELEAVDGGVAVRIWLDVNAPFAAQEYHFSLVLNAAYERWATDQEEGLFVPFDPSSEHWQHLNQRYAPGRQATAWSSSFPSVTLEVAMDEAPFRMTAINTRPQEQARVLQALRAADEGLLHFDVGRHLYFAGILRACAPET